MNDRKYKSANNLADFFRNNWIVIIGCILVLPPLIKYLMYMLKSIGEQAEEDAKDARFRANKNPAVLKEHCIDSIDSANAFHSNDVDTIIGWAQKLAQDLGYFYSDTDDWWSWLDPRGWTENDAAVKDTLIACSGEFEAVALCYYEVTRSRNLFADVQKCLDNGQKQELTNYGYNF